MRRYGILLLAAGLLLVEFSTINPKPSVVAFPPPAPPVDHPDLKKIVKPATQDPATQPAQVQYQSSPGKSNRRFFGRHRHR